MTAKGCCWPVTCKTKIFILKYVWMFPMCAQKDTLFPIIGMRGQGLLSLVWIAAYRQDFSLLLIMNAFM